MEKSPPNGTPAPYSLKDIVDTDAVWLDVGPSRPSRKEIILCGVKLDRIQNDRAAQENFRKRKHDAITSNVRAAVAAAQDEEGSNSVATTVPDTSERVYGHVDDDIARLAEADCEDVLRAISKLRDDQASFKNKLQYLAMQKVR